MVIAYLIFPYSKVDFELQISSTITEILINIKDHLHVYFDHDFCLIAFLFIGIELVLGTRVKSADVKRKTLLTATGETITYRFLIIATGARVLKLLLHLSD